MSPSPGLSRFLPTTASAAACGSECPHSPSSAPMATRWPFSSVAADFAGEDFSRDADVTEHDIGASSSAWPASRRRRLGSGPSRHSPNLSVSELDHSDFSVIARGTFKGALVIIRTTGLDPGKPHLCPAFQAGRTIDGFTRQFNCFHDHPPNYLPAWSRDDGVTLEELGQSTESTDDAEPPFGVVGLLGRAWRSWSLLCPAQGSPPLPAWGLPALAGTAARLLRLVSERVP